MQGANISSPTSHLPFSFANSPSLLNLFFRTAKLSQRVEIGEIRERGTELHLAGPVGRSAKVETKMWDVLPSVSALRGMLVVLGSWLCSRAWKPTSRCLKHRVQRGFFPSLAFLMWSQRQDSVLLRLQIHPGSMNISAGRERREKAAEYLHGLLASLLHHLCLQGNT